MDLLSFTWDIIKGLIDTLVNAVSFVKDIALIIPNFISTLPTEISVLLLSAFTILIAVFIYRFIK